MDPLERHAFARLRAPMTAWEKSRARATQDQNWFTRDFMASLAIKALRLSLYLEERAWGNDHEGAVHVQNKKIEGVRKALGYTYPKQDITF